MSIRSKVRHAMEQYCYNSLLPHCYEVAIALVHACIENPQLASSYTLEKYNLAVLEHMKGGNQDE